MFYEQGYDAAGMRSIAEAAGVRPASLYHHFASKQEMLHRIVGVVTRDFIDAHLSLLDQDGDPADRLEQLLRLHIKYFAEHRLSEEVGMRELRNLAPEKAREVRADRLRYQHAIQDFIAKETARGTFRVADPRLTGIALLDMINGINAWFNEGGRFSIEELADSYAQIAVRQLLGAAPRTANSSDTAPSDA
jgi:AcrR family transcriptional regulator